MRMKNLTTRNLKRLGFIGMDASLAISLFEQGLAWRERPKTGEIEFIYGIAYADNGDYSGFDHCSLPADTNVTEWDWVDWGPFLSFVGEPMENWNSRFLPYKIYDLIAYYGWDNVLGTSYLAATIRNNG